MKSSSGRFSATAVALGFLFLVNAAHGAGMRKTLILGGLFGGSGSRSDGAAASAITISSSSSSATATSFSSSRTSISDDGCQTQTQSTSSGGGIGFATGSIQGPCDVQSESTSISEGEETASAEATAKADIGKSATAISSAIGSGDGVDVASNAVATAVKDGNGKAVAIAVATSIKDGCPKDTKKKDCPAEIATGSIVNAYASAENEADGLAFAEAIAVGLASKDKGVPSVFATAISRILKDDGCKKTEPLLSEARAIAVGDGSERRFIDALDFDVKIAECIFEECTGELLICCSLEEGQECGCTEGNCDYELYKETPVQMWRDNDAKEGATCLCPTAN